MIAATWNYLISKYLNSNFDEYHGRLAYNQPLFFRKLPNNYSFLESEEQ